MSEQRDYWNRCDACGRFIAMEEFDKGAERYLLTPDSEYAREEFATFCVKHAGLRMPTRGD